jgi:hypothetical protein
MFNVKGAKIRNIADFTAGVKKEKGLDRSKP